MLNNSYGILALRFPEKLRDILQIHLNGGFLRFAPCMFRKL